MSGTATFDDESVDSTIGATRKNSPMDSFLDAVSRLFGRGDAVQRREGKRQAALRAASSAAPVIAQRPVAPLRTVSRSNDGELKMTTMSDDGGIDSVVSEQGDTLALSSQPQSETEKVYAWDSNTPAQQSDESIESMAMISVTQHEVTQPKEVIPSPVGKL